MRGARVKDKPWLTKSSKVSIAKLSCRSPHGSSVGNPAFMVSKSRIFIGCPDSGIPILSVQGRYWAISSSRRSSPRSRSIKTAIAVKLLVIDAMRKTLS